MNIKAIISAALATLFFVGAAHAVTITNRDSQAYKLTVMQGETTKDVTIQPNQTIKGICADNCGIRINDDEGNEYEVDQNEIVSIEQGQLTFDGDAQDQGSATDTQSTGSTSQ